MLKKSFNVCEERYFDKMDKMVERFNITKKDIITCAIANFINRLIEEKMTANNLFDLRLKLRNYDIASEVSYKKTSVCIDEDALLIINMIFAKYNGVVSKNDIFNLAIFMFIYDVKEEKIDREKVQELYEDISK